MKLAKFLAIAALAFSTTVAFADEHKVEPKDAPKQEMPKDASKEPTKEDAQKKMDEVKPEAEKK